MTYQEREQWGLLSWWESPCSRTGKDGSRCSIWKSSAICKHGHQ